MTDPATAAATDPDNEPEPGRAAPITVLVADDQKVVREGLTLLLGLLDGIAVVGAATDGADAVRQVAALDPDIVLMDLKMPHLDGVAATQQLTDSGARARVLVLTTFSDDDWVFRALQAGAKGYLTKDAGAADIERAIHNVASGDAQLDPSVQRRLLEALLAGRPAGTAEQRAAGNPTALRSAQRPAATELQEALTPREVDVLREIAAGRSNGEIAAHLFVSAATVKTHVNHLLSKTGCRDRAALVVFAYRSGLAAPQLPE